MGPVTLSFSRLQAYQRCPWLFHLVFEEGWRSGPKSNSALGHSLHNALAAYLSCDNADRSLDKLREIYDSVWVNEGFSGPQETFQKYEEGWAMLDRFHQQDQRRSDRVLFTEKKFDFDWDGLHIQGTVDRIDQSPDGTCTVVEYKSRRAPWTEERIATDLQMTFYAWGVQEGLGLKPLRLKYYFLSSGETAETDRRSDAIENLKTRLTSMAEQIRIQNYPPNHDHCSACEIGRRCSFFKEKK